MITTGSSTASFVGAAKGIRSTPGEITLVLAKLGGT